MSAEDAGSIYAEIRLSLKQMEKDGIDAQNAMDRLAQKFRQQGSTAGKGFAGGMKQGFDNVENSAARLGRQLATKLSPAILAIGAGIKIFQGIGTAIKNAFNSNENFTNAMENLKSSLGASFTAATKPVSDWFANLIEKAARSVKQAREVKEALDRIKNENFIDSENDLGGRVKQARDDVKTLMIEVENIETKIQNTLDSHRLSPSLRASRVENYKAELEEVKKELEVAVKDSLELNELISSAPINQINRWQEIDNERKKARDTIMILEKEDAINQKEADEMRVSSLNNFINSLSEVIAMEKAKGENVDFITEKLIEQIAARNDLLTLINKEITDQQKIEEARLAAILKYEQAEQRARQANKDGLISEEEMNNRINSALSSKYDDLQSIVLQYKLTTGAVVDLRNETAALVKTNQDLVKSKENQEKIDAHILSLSEENIKLEIESWKALAASAVKEKDRNKAIEEAIKLELQLFDAQRKRAWDAIKNSDEYIAASDKEREEIIMNFEKITKASRDAIKNSNKDGSFFEKIIGSERMGYIAQAGQSAIDLFNTIAEASLEIARRVADQQIAIIEKVLEKKLDSIEKARDAELIANGFIVQDSKESLEQQLADAIRTGDEVLIYLAERRLQEQLINERFDAEAKAAEEEARKQKAKIEYDYAMQQYRIQKAQAHVSIAQAHLTAAQSAPWPWNLIPIGFATAIGIAQIATINANKPQPPKFEDGGIVPGNKYSGDRVHALVNSGELILNRAQQDNISNQLTNNSGTMSATIVLMLDKNVLAKSTVDLINDGFYEIKSRAIK